MVTEPTGLLIPVIHIVTLFITGTSAVFVYRQRTSDYPQVRNLLVMVHVFYMGVVSLEFARTFVPTSTPPPLYTQVFLSIYTISGTTFVLADVFLLTLVAVAIYYRPRGINITDILREVGNHQLGATLLVLFTIYVVIAEGYILLVPTAFSPQTLTNIFGTQEVATLFDSQYLAMLLGILLIFITYPTTLLVLARRRTEDGQVRRAFAILPIAWVGIGIDLLVFNGYLLNQGIDASSLGYLFAAVAFSATAATFRRATLLSDFFKTGLTPAKLAPLSTTFSGRIGKETDDIVGKEYLLEVDPSAKFEEGIREFAAELGAKQYPIFAFTASGSPVYNSLQGLGNVRFFTMTRKVSYPKPGERPEEVLVPASDQSVLLNVLDKAINSSQKQVGVVFDSVSDVILTSGLEMTYKFLKQANEMLSGGRVTSLFLLTLGAHSEKELNVVKSLFSNILTMGQGQLSVAKGG